MAKASTVPQGGWTQEEFATSNGGALEADMARIYRAVVSRNLKDFSEFLRQYFNRQLEQLIAYVQASDNTTAKGAKGPVNFDFGGNEQLWAAAIEDVFRNANAEIVIKVLPKVQSAAAQACSQAGILLGSPNTEANPAILRRAQGLARQVTGINDTTRERLSNTINEALTNNKTVAETVGIIRANFPTIAENRIQTIARTELGRAVDEGVKEALKSSSVVTHVSVIGCRAIEPGIPTYKGIPTCNIQNVPVQDIDMLTFHPNHTGAIVASGFRGEGGRAPDVGPVHTPGQTAPQHRIPDIAELDRVRDLGGSTGAQLMVDRETGKQWVVKRNNPDHLREEWAADEVYRAMKVRVPAGRLIDTGGTVYRITEFIEGDSIGDVMAGTNLARKARAIEQMEEGFHIDAMIANQDVIGDFMDNVVVDRLGNAWRVDNGSAFRFRAQGAEKDFTAFPTHLWTLRNSAINKNAASVFGKIDYYKLSARIEAMDAEKLLAATPEPLKATMRERIKNAKHVASKGLDMETDGWKSKYSDRLGEGIIKLREEGWTASLPKELSIQQRTDFYASPVLLDENGVPWDDLRGPNGQGEKLLAFLGREKGDKAERLIRKWASDQGSGSHEPSAVAIKKIISDNMVVPQADFYWRDTQLNFSGIYISDLGNGLAANEVRDAFAFYHAAVQEIFDNVSMPNVDRAMGVARLMRTEDLSVMHRYGLKAGDKATYMTRGANESASLVKAVQAEAGCQLTVQAVPTSRMTGFWGLGRRDSGNGTWFFMDDENEVTFISHGLKFDYRGDSFAFEPESGDKGRDATKWGLHLPKKRAKKS